MITKKFLLSFSIMSVYKKAMDIIGEIGLTIFYAITSFIYVTILMVTGVIVATYYLIVRPELKGD